MTAPGALQFYLGSSNSTLRISYVGINYADTEGIRNIDHSSLNIDHYFDLQGRAFKNGQWSMDNGQLRKGIYVKGGKKYILK
ncbi:MAG: hypothetical protein IJV45_08515 [Prevotella sp.]|nr:hypothetical protein [Prevotella sp.]